MPREARVKSETGIYHIMLRGIDKRNIFLAEEEYTTFLQYLGKAQKNTSFTLFAFCLMTNHVHLLLKTEGTPGNIVRRIAVGYAQYHNIRNGRSGHLFQNRFKSEAVSTDKYFLTVLRYINQNPVKAGMVRDMKDYKWSSYQEYFHGTQSLVDTAFIYDYFTDLPGFATFMEKSNDDECLDYQPTKRWTDNELLEYIRQITDLSQIRTSDKNTRDEALASIKTQTKASNRQLARVLGIGRGVMEKAK